MNKLTEELIKPFLNEIGTDTKIKTIIGIYPGRFQPAGRHHAKTFEWLKKKFGKNTFVVTSNKQEPSKSPLNFKEKQMVWKKHGVSSDKVVQVKNPYIAEEVLKKYDPETTAVVFIFGAKDAGRLKGGKNKSGKLSYFQPLKNIKDITGYQEHGYFLVAPHISIKVGGKEISGTMMRTALGSKKIDEKKKKVLFKEIFGWYDDKLFSLLTKRFEKSVKEIKESLPTKVSDKYKKLKQSDDKDLKKFKQFTDHHKYHSGPHIDGIESEPETYDFDDSDESKPGVQKRKKDKKKRGYEPVTEIEVPIKVGDTVLMGKFKNKKVIVKAIGFNEKGDMVINGKSASKFRIIKQPNIFDEQMVKEFLTTIDINTIIKEATTTALSGLQAVDSGPNALMNGMGGYAGRNKKQAEQLGWEVIDYILDVDVSKIPPFTREFKNKRVNSVSFLPAGIGTGKTSNNQDNLTGVAGYNKWVKNMKKIAQTVGFELMKFKDDDEIKKQISKDTRDTLKQQKGEEKDKEVELKKPKVEELFSQNWWKKQILTEGGSFGHLQHPFDNKNLTFGDFKRIITLGLSGRLDVEGDVTEKTDGQAIAVSWKNGKLIAARNKGDRKNFGENALDLNGIISKFKGRGDISDAFTFAMKDLQKAVSSLSEKQQNKIFAEGEKFMNLEIIWPASVNVINYDKAVLQFHGSTRYDRDGNPVEYVKSDARILEGMIRKINQHIQKKFTIIKPQVLNIPKHQDFTKKRKYFINKLQKLQKQFDLSDNDQFGMYHQRFWEEFIYNAGKQYNYEVPFKVLKGLTKRWAFFDKSYKVTDVKNDIKDDKFLDWTLSVDKKDHKKYVQQNMLPFEKLFFELGAEILSNVSGFLAVNPDKTIMKLKKDVDKEIKNIKGSKDPQKIELLNKHLEKINSYGGFEKIVPTEGLTFLYKGELYKITGNFGPLNALLGILKFSR
jgi:hypothetical protein